MTTPKTEPTILPSPVLVPGTVPGLPGQVQPGVIVPGQVVQPQHQPQKIPTLHEAKPDEHQTQVKTSPRTDTEKKK